ncbi:thiamine pyrophosphate-dependent enzyme [Tyzzerella sp. OttesenSCG-928-J15]|nr:thiamine pyrophosphate-dependent enzyme [Tyzzerella sp. OttesenSCG-928-J15]
MEQVFKKTNMLRDVEFHYCPGCTHGVIHRLIAECIEELGQSDNCIGIAPVGCAVLAYDYFNCDMLEAAHGRAPAVATGVKRVHPDKLVFSYQGDGDLASIGAAEIVHAAARSENISVFFVNNAIYGMTGGQMAPTTLLGQKATTSPHGRDAHANGLPIRMSELLATIDGAYYIERTAVCDFKSINNTKKAIKKALQNQIDGKGFSMVEILSTCPTNWGMTPFDATKWVMETMSQYYPIGLVKEGN